jgi:Bacterial pre-peptidase C-terminal domain
VFNQHAFTRNIFVSCLALFALSTIGGLSPAAAQICQEELDDSTGYVTLTNGNTALATKTVDEWDDDVIKITTDRPGVITIQSTGPGAQNSLYTEGSTGFHPLVDSAYQGTGLEDLEVIVPAGDHCIQVVPDTTGSAEIEVEATFIDACHLGATDDYGNSFLCAAPFTVDASATSAVISVPGTTSDYDMFTFTLTSTATVTIESTGSTDVAGSLYDDDGLLLESNDNGGTSPNFRIVRSLAPGRYYVRVEGVNDDGSYTFRVTD